MSEPTGDGGVGESRPQTADGWKGEYEASEELQKEFHTVGAYTAFKKAEAAGRVKVLGARK
jgi:hypothetical protein